MFKKTIKYRNFNDEEVTKDFYFHLSKAELIKMAAAGDMQERISRMIATKDNASIMQEFEAILRMAVGVRSEDGETFVKTPEAQAVLLFSPAYDELMIELCTNANAAADFINELIPPAMQKELQKQLGIQQETVPTEEDTRPAWLKENRPPSEEELKNATKEELQLAFKMRMNRR